MASVEYSGSAGRKLYSIGDITRLGCGTLFLGSSTPSANGGTTSRCNGIASSINMRGNLGYSNYNGLTFSLESNNLRNSGMTFTARYTLSNARDNLSSTFSDNSFFNLGFTDSYDPKLDYGNSDFDVRHRFSGSMTYEMPWYKDSSSAIAKNVLGGWSLNTLVSVRSGYPFTIYAFRAGSAAVARLTPSAPIVVQTNGPSTGQPNQFILVDTTNQTRQTPPGATGNFNFGPYPIEMTKRNQFYGPGFWDVTAGLYKRIHITERVNLQLRGEVFNVFNHANRFIDYGSAFFFPGADPVFAIKDGRRNVQLAAKIIF